MMNDRDHQPYMTVTYWDWDEMYGWSSREQRVATCDECGAIVHEDAVTKHRKFHRD